MSLETDIELLRQVPTFDILNGEALRILAISSEQKDLSAGETLFKTGEAADCGYVLASGLLHLVEEDKDGTQHLLQEVRPGALVGELSLILANARPSTAVAVRRSTVLRLPRTTFLRTLEGFPEAALRLRKAFAARLEQTMEELAQVRLRLENEGLGKPRR